MISATQLLWARLVLAVAGVLTWGYAVRYDDAPLRVVGMVLLAISLLMRFLRRARTDQEPQA